MALDLAVDNIVIADSIDCGVNLGEVVVVQFGALAD
jgi:hypothetical protein